jgi:hypothetical protein
MNSSLPLLTSFCRVRNELFGSKMFAAGHLFDVCIHCTRQHRTITGG